jgi:hypothetical protein
VFDAGGGGGGGGATAAKSRTVMVTGSVVTPAPAAVSSDALVGSKISIWKVPLCPAASVAGFSATVTVFALTSPSGQVTSPCVAVAPPYVPPAIVR